MTQSTANPRQWCNSCAPFPERCSRRWQERCRFCMISEKDTRQNKKPEEQVVSLPAFSIARVVALCAAALMLSGCALPRSGPSRNEIFAGSVQQAGDAFVVQVNDRVTRATSVVPELGFPERLQRAGQVAADMIRPGDVLSFTIYENVDAGLLSAAGTNASQLEQVQVNDNGYIFIPYAGRIRAAGRTTAELREAIGRNLGAQTPDPQVMVRRAAGDGATVSVVGGVGAQGVYPIERPTRTLTAMLARAGGVVVKPEIARVSVIRGESRAEAWFQDLYEEPRMDIALRAGDRILVEEDTRAFTALGATGGQTRVPFESQNLSALEAIARVGGLRTTVADPRGVFVLRNEPEEIANAVLGRDDLTGTQRMIYLLDLTQPNGMFLARDFVIRDGDTVYVTEAPFVRAQKVLSAITGTLTAATTVESVTDIAN